MRKLLVLLAACALVVAFTVPAKAASEWGFYGSARMMTFMQDASKEVTGTGFDDEDLTWALQGNSRIGARVKAGDVSGRFEYGSTPNLRLLYGTWNFGAGSLIVGQAYTPVFTPISGQLGLVKYGGDINAFAYGGAYDGRVPQIKLKIAGLQVALLTPNVVAATDLIPDDTDTTVPKIEASYGFKAGPVALYFYGGYNTYDAVVQTATEKEYSIDSHVYGFSIKFAAGPAYINANVYAGENPANFGLLQDIDYGAAAYNSATDSIDDCETLGYLAVVGFKVSDLLKIEAGYGVVKNEIESPAATKYEFETVAWYIQAPITLAKGVYIVPEVGKVDYGDEKVTGLADVEMGDVTYYGVKWQINF